MGILSALGITKTGSQKGAERALRDEHGQEMLRRRQLDAQAGDARNRFVEGLNAFDPQEYARETAESIGADAQEGLVSTIASSNQQLNARGFYGGGLNTGRITRDFNDRLARALGALSMDTAQLELGRLGGYQDLYGMDAERADYTRGSELDLLADHVDRERDDRAGRLGGTMDLVSSGMKFVGGL